MAQLLGNVAVGSTVYLNENGSPQPYLVVHQGLPSSMYDVSCDGTWLLRKDCYEKRQWYGSYSNSYKASTIYIYLNGTFLNLFEAGIREAIKQVKIPYVNGTANTAVASGANGLSCKIFLLSGYEVGWTQSNNPCFPKDGVKLSYFNSGTGSSALNKRIAKLNGSATDWWLRSPYTDDTYNVWYVVFNGNYDLSSCVESYGIRPALVMPSRLIVDDSNNVIANQIIPPNSIIVPSIAMQQQALLISWSPVSATGADVTYQLQRNADNGGWTTIYTGADTSYTDTAGTWTQVQYQVAPVIEGVVGVYTQSSIIPVVDPSVLVISGQDGNLGTLTSNLPYTVSSNTGNPISLTRTVNNVQVVTLTVASGFAYSIPIADLPTGTGTIQITASVESGSETVTQTRTWTYYKTPINIPSTGGIAQLTQKGQNIWPTTIVDAVQAPVYLGGNLNAALNKLGQAALYTKIGSPKYNEVTVDLSNVSVGDEVSLPYNEVMVSHIVVHIGNPDASMYDSSCDGVWLLRKDCVAQGQWNSTNVNTLSGSTIMATMQGYVSQYDTTVSSQIKTVKIPYCVGNRNTTINTLGNGLQCQMFPLSGYEVGFTTSNSQYFPVDGAVLSYFQGTASTDSKRIANYNGSATIWWLRSPITNVTDYAWFVSSKGSYEGDHCYNSYGIRPCFILPTTFTATYYVDSSNNIHPSQEYTTGGSITDVFGYDVPICQYEVGSYVGTGTYGSGNQTSISLSFTPKFVCITNQTDNSKRAFLPYGGYGVCWTSNAITSSAISGYGLATVWAMDEISWYNSSSAVQQMNESGDTYQYTAFG